jgi:hypothetical protein
MKESKNMMKGIRVNKQAKVGDGKKQHEGRNKKKREPEQADHRGPAV